MRGVITNFDDPKMHERFGSDLSTALQAMDLIKGASPAFDHEEFLAGKQTPGFFFGSAINNFGVRKTHVWSIWHPRQIRNAIQREVLPDEKKFSGNWRSRFKPI